MSRLEGLRNLLQRSAESDAFPAVVLITGAQVPQAIETIRADARFHRFDTVVLGQDEPPAIEEIRAFIAQAHVKPMFGALRLFVVLNVDELSPEAATTFLKIIEEPPASARFVLAARSARRVIPTLRSRALEIPTAEDTQIYSEWLTTIHAVLKKELSQQFILARQLAQEPARAEIIATLGDRFLLTNFASAAALSSAEDCFDTALRLRTNANSALQLEQLFTALYRKAQGVSA